MAVYGYARVSTDRQAEDGESLGAQQRTIEGYAMMHGLNVDAVLVERGVSGSKPLEDRPEGAKLLQAIQQGDTVITSKLDRMFRSAVDALHVCDRLKRAGVSLHMIDLGGDVTSDGISRLVFTILSAVAEAERDRTRERIRDVKADQRGRGRYLGGTTPFGWTKDDKGGLVAAPDEQKAISDMVEMRNGGASLRKISEAMRERGFAISHVAVKNALQRADEVEVPA